MHHSISKTLSGQFENRNGIWRPLRAKALLFDCDGVLVNSEPKMIEAELEWMLKFGIDMDEADYHTNIKGKNIPGKLEVIKGAFFKERGAEFKYFEYGFMDIHNKEHERITPADAMPGVEEVLEFSKEQGFLLAVLSNSRAHNLEEKMKRTGLAQYFDGHINSFQHVARPKPYPDLCLHAIKKLGVAPGESAMVEDSATGLMAPLRAHIPAIGFGDLALADKGAAVAVKDMQTLKAYIEYSINFYRYNNGLDYDSQPIPCQSEAPAL